MDKLEQALLLQKQGKTRQEIFKELGYSRVDVLTNMMKKNGYIYDKKLKQYVLAGDTPECDSSHAVQVVQAQELEQVVEQRAGQEVLVLEPQLYDKQIQADIIDLASNYKQLKDMLNWYQEQVTQECDTRQTGDIIEIVDQGIQLELPQAVNDRVSIRLNSDVWKQFGDFATRNSEFQKGDLVAQALLDYMSKHRDK